MANPADLIALGEDDNNDGYDLIILGGGITGSGIARDAALRGLRVALFEKGDFGSGTSSKSSKLIHGGLRYLEHGEIGLVFESVSERRVQSLMAPHLVRPLPFLVPIFEDNRVGLETMNLGLWLYDTLALFRAPRMHKTFRGKKAKKLEPLLGAEKLKGVLEYYDCFTDDARLVLENIIAANQAGADCYNHTEVVSIERTESKVSAVVVRDRVSNEQTTVKTRAVIVAAGPWTDTIAGGLGIQFKSRLLRPTKGVHLVFPAEKLPIERAITLISPVDDRVMFAIPWRTRVVIGTTDTDFNGSVDEVHATAEDARYLCESANAYFPTANFSPQDAISTWAGLRPLINEEAEDESDVSREHQIFVRDDGVILIAGGKLTTYRIMAKETVRAALNWLRDNRSETLDDRKIVRPRTKKRPLPGAKGLDEASAKGIKKLAKQLAAAHELTRPLAEHLAWTYGVRAHKIARSIAANPSLGELMQKDLAHVWAEVDFAVHDDLAKNVDDVLSRRIPLLLVGREQGLDIAARVADRLAELLDWSPDQRDTELARYQQTVADSRRFRTD